MENTESRAASGSIDETILERMRSRLEFLYGDRSEDGLQRLQQLAEQYSPFPTARRTQWDERDVVLISYADQVRDGGTYPLRSLADFVANHHLDELIQIVHLLPFYPSTSDDGFAVADYRAVDPETGGWDDIRILARRFDLMFDLVLNHTSRRHEWFQKFVAGEAPWTDYYLDTDPAADLSAVVRPRSLPLLTPVATSRGTRHVWTTFSSDQVDLNYANLDVLLELVANLLFYIKQGARIIRLDAVAFLWKEIGTPCIHLPQTHELVKLLRDLVSAVAPHVLLLTETNVPHAENVRYFGSGDEAHLVYQFSLPPLVLDAMLHRDATPLVNWLKQMEELPPGTSFLNFTASHDGIGVRPLEGLVSADRMNELLKAVAQRGGLTSTRRRPDGQDAPYELNISYVSAVGEPEGLDVELHARRFLTTQGLMLALRGIPAVYFHSLVGATNDDRGARESGIARRINRRKFKSEELAGSVANPDSLSGKIFSGYCKLISVRIRQSAFHPDATQEVMSQGPPWLIAFLRTSLDGQQRILVLANCSGESQSVDLSKLCSLNFRRELLTDQAVGESPAVELPPWGLAWFES